MAVRAAVVAAVMAVVCGQVWADCYTVHGPDGAVMFRDSISPVDLSLRLGDTVPARFGIGATMVMVPGQMDCQRSGAAGAEQPFSGDRWAHLEWGSPKELGESAQDGWPWIYNDSVAVAPSRLGYPYIGPRGGRYRITSGGHRAYAPRLR